MISVHDRAVLMNIAGRALSTRETIINSFEMAEYCIVNNIPGDFVECGVFAGAQVACMAYAIQKYKSNKKIHLFDSFEGIPMAGKNDICIRGCIGEPSVEGALKTTGISSCSVEQVKQHMREWNFPESMFVYYKGWFQDVLPNLPNNVLPEIALLRLDGDLYDSTKCCLDNLGYSVTKGGVFIIDDWALDGCRQAVEEYWKKEAIQPKYKTVENSTPIYWMKE